LFSRLNDKIANGVAGPPREVLVAHSKQAAEADEEGEEDEQEEDDEDEDDESVSMTF